MTGRSPGTADGKPPPQRRRDKGQAMRDRIAAGAIEVIARQGVAGLTHRALARAAGTSLAATTYHFETKAEILDAASRALLEGYVAAFGGLEQRLQAGAPDTPETLDELVARVVQAALGRERARSLAWCEIILHGARDPARRAVVRGWYDAVGAIWGAMAERLAPGVASADSAAEAIDMAVGLIFILHPLAPPHGTVAPLLAGHIDLGTVLAGMPQASPPAADSPARARVIQAAVEILTEGGAAAVTHARIAARAGMARSGPAHHAEGIAGLLESAQIALFRRAKARYRDGLAEAGPAPADRDRLLDVTTAIFFREATEFAAENAGHYSGWIAAAHNAALRAAVVAAQADQHAAWCRRLAATGGGAAAPVQRAALGMQAQFIGMLIRSISGGIDLAGLSRVRAALSRRMTAG